MNITTLKVLKIYTQKSKATHKTQVIKQIKWM